MAVLVNLSFSSEKYKRRPATINKSALPINGKEKQSNTHSKILLLMTNEKNQPSTLLFYWFVLTYDHRCEV